MIEGEAVWPFDMLMPRSMWLMKMLFSMVEPLQTRSAPPLPFVPGGALVYTALTTS